MCSGKRIFARSTAQATRVIGIAAAALSFFGAERTATAQFSVDARTTHPVGADPYGVTAADFNADGLPDLAVVNGTSSSVSILLRVASGGFVEEAGSPIPVGTGPNYAVSGDFNTDGRLDLAIANYVSSNVTILLRQAAGGFAQREASWSCGASRRADSLRSRR